MRLRSIFPEAIPGPAAWVYSLGPGRVVRPVQERLAESVCDVLAPALPGHAPTVLDIGCGPGWLAIGIARRRPDAHVIAVDLSHEMTKIARRNAVELDNVEVRCENAASMSLSDGEADLVVSSESMHHWRDPVVVLDEIHRVLSPGGRAYIFDGRDDFTDEELADWIPLAAHARKSALGRTALAIPRAILRTHGFTHAEWLALVPSLVERSRFGHATIEPVGIYQRIELVREAAIKA